MKQTVDNVTLGVLPDLPAVILPDGAFTESRNFRYRENAVEKVRGHVGVFNSLSGTAIWAEPVNDGLTEFWVYGTDSTLYATDGSAHANVSSITYTADLNVKYTGGAYHGFMLANDGVNPPQYWTPALGNKFQPVPAWPASTTCKVVRPLGDFIFALRVTESAVYNPRMLRWSDVGAVGAMPSSWDYTDPTNRSGRTELGQTQDQLIDLVPMRDVGIIYKQRQTWAAQFIGGDDVFQFRLIFSQAGMLSEDCGKAFGSQHFVVTDNDVVVHDGANATSLIDKRLRRWLFNNLSITRYERAFVAANHKDREMWFCFPEEGNDWPNLAACWSWIDNSWYIRDLGEQMTHGSSGIVTGSGVVFDADPGLFDTGPAGVFDEYDYTPWAQRMLLTAATKQKAYQGDTTALWDGRTMTAYAIRDYIGLSKDTERVKRIRRIFPRVIGTPGDVVQFWVGTRMTAESAVLMTGPYDFTIGTDYKIDCRVSGRALTLKLQYRGTNDVRMAGFDVEFDPDGYR